MDPRISIHAPLTGRDDQLTPGDTVCFGFQSTRPLRGATDHSVTIIGAEEYEFQSTRPLRGATNAVAMVITALPFQSTRPLRGATMRLNSLRSLRYHFNPRAPYGARRQRSISSLSKIIRFQSTRPLRGATIGSIGFSSIVSISIHAPLTGRDLVIGNVFGMA